MMYERWRHVWANVASHDLQELLRKIRAFGDRLKSQYGETLSTRGCNYLERMQQAAARMQTLIEDLLTFSRVATKAQPFRSVDLAQVAREVIADLEVRLEQGGGRIDLAPLPTIDADPMQMRQLLQNLLGNALKFSSPESLPVVKLSSSRATDPTIRPTTNGSPAPCCQLLVEDNGIGFDEQYLDRIVGPFQRLHGRGEYEGTGRHRPILAFTAHAMQGDVERCLAAGMDGDLAKPFQAHELQAALARLLSGVPGPEALDAPPDRSASMR